MAAHDEDPHRDLAVGRQQPELIGARRNRPGDLGRCRRWKSHGTVVDPDRDTLSAVEVVDIHRAGVADADTDGRRGGRPREGNVHVRGQRPGRMLDEGQERLGLDCGRSELRERGLMTQLLVLRRR